MKKILIVLILLTGLSSAQNIRFVVVDKLDVNEKTGQNKLVKIANSLNQLKNIDFVLFNEFSAPLLEPDPVILRTIKKINHPLYLLPGSEDFWRDKTSREKFLNNFGDLNFRKNLDTTKMIGLNSTVAWSDEPYFERETLNFVKNQKLDSLSNAILILNSNPEKIRNFDLLPGLFNGSKIKFIIAPLSTNKNFINDKISILNTSLNSRKGEAFILVDVSSDSIRVSSATTEGKFSGENIYTFEANRFTDSRHKVEKDKLVKWSYDLGYSIASDIITYDNYIFAADVSGQVVCLDSLGKKKWDYFSFGYIYSSPTILDGYLGIATVQGDIETINARNGKAIQSLGFDSPITSDLLSFEFTGSYSNLMIPKQSRSKAAVVAGTQSGDLYCYDFETLQELWRFEKPDAAIIQRPLLTKNQIIFYSLDGTLYSVNSQTGLLSWSSKLTNKNESNIYSSQIVSNNEDVFISLSNGKIFSIDILLGKKNWEYDKYKLSTTLNISDDGRHLYAKSTNDRFHVLSAKTGTWVRELITNIGDDNSETEIVELRNNIFFGNEEGFLIELDDNYKTQKLARTDETPLFSIVKINNNNLVTAYHNGIISLIRTK